MVNEVKYIAGLVLGKSTYFYQICSWHDFQGTKKHLIFLILRVGVGDDFLTALGFDVLLFSSKLKNRWWLNLEGIKLITFLKLFFLTFYSW